MLNKYFEIQFYHTPFPVSATSYSLCRPSALVKVPSLFRYSRTEMKQQVIDIQEGRAGMGWEGLGRAGSG